jgi:hypothetical protein
MTTREKRKILSVIGRCLDRISRELCGKRPKNFKSALYDVDEELVLLSEWVRGYLNDDQAPEEVTLASPWRVQ